jgi:hypothetical protein
MSELIVTQRKSIQEMKACWFSKEDLAKFKTKSMQYSRRLVDAWPTVAQAYIEKSIDVEVDQAGCRFHGLEHVCGIEHTLSQAIMAMLVTTRNMVISDVFEEQKRQKVAGENNIELVAQASANSSAFSRAWRHRIAVINSTE